MLNKIVFSQNNFWRSISGNMETKILLENSVMGSKKVTFYFPILIRFVLSFYFFALFSPMTKSRQIYSNFFPFFVRGKKSKKNKTESLSINNTCHSFKTIIFEWLHYSWHHCTAYRRVKYMYQKLISLKRESLKDDILVNRLTSELWR